MAIVNDYISQLKEESGCSWKDLERLTGYPSSTIRDHLTGKTAKTDVDILISVVSAMGGDPDRIAAVPPQLCEDLSAVRMAESKIPADPDEYRVTLDTMRRLRVEMLDLQRKSYERELSSVRSERNTFRRWVIILLAVIIILMFATIVILIYDLAHIDRGWFQAFFGIGSSSSQFNVFLFSLSDLLKGLFHV